MIPVNTVRQRNPQDWARPARKHERNVTRLDRWLHAVGQGGAVGAVLEWPACDGVGSCCSAWPRPDVLQVRNCFGNCRSNTLIGGASPSAPANGQQSRGPNGAHPSGWGCLPAHRGRKGGVHAICFGLFVSNSRPLEPPPLFQAAHLAFG